MRTRILAFVLLTSLLSCNQQEMYDTIIRNGDIYDGRGQPSYLADLGIKGDSIVKIGDLKSARAKKEIDARGMAVTPGFINMLSWANESLIEDGRSMSDIKQGVTLEVFGEGWSGGPLNPKMKKEQQKYQGDIKYKVNWTSFGGFLKFLEKKGVSCNIASFVGASTVRVHEIDHENRAPTAKEMKTMRQLVRQAMEEGAVGLGASLIYAPAFYASTEELIELCKVVAEYDGLYISHLRSEGNALLRLIRLLLQYKYTYRR